jgi:hypothetical protein
MRLKDSGQVVLASIIATQALGWPQLSLEALRTREPDPMASLTIHFSLRAARPGIEWAAERTSTNRGACDGVNRRMGSAEAVTVLWAGKSSPSALTLVRMFHGVAVSSARKTSATIPMLKPPGHFFWPAATCPTELNRAAWGLTSSWPDGRSPPPGCGRPAAGDGHPGD